MIKLSNVFLSLVLIFVINGCGSGDTPSRSAGEIIEGQSFEDYLTSENFSGSVLIVDNDIILLNRGFGLANNSSQQENNADTIFRLASITKQFTAMAVMLLQERGILSIDMPVSTYIDDYPKGDTILLRHLLTHTSGIIRDFASEPPTNAITPEQLIELFKNAPLQSVPGEKFAYSNSGYKLLGLIIERVSGLSYADFIEQEIFVPLGMSRSGFGPDTPDNDNSAHGYFADGTIVNTQNMSLAYSGGGLVSTSNDLYKWDQSFYQNLLVSQDTKDQIFTPGLSNYGFGWSIEEVDGEQTYSHGGALAGFRTIILRSPVRSRLIVLLSNENGFPVEGVAENLVLLID